MIRRLIAVLIFFACAGWLPAQEFKLFDRTVQVHGFASQGFIHTDDNNWLTMYTSNIGSGEFTDLGANASTQITDSFRIGAQIYDRNLGHLGKWHPSLDWAYAQYKFKPWLGIRGGKVKTVMGLYNDTQDLDFLHTFALLPQSVYPIDLRDTTIAHEGGDIFGDIHLGNRPGTLSYTAFAGHRQDSQYGGYAYLLTNQGMTFDGIGGLQYGGDLRWATPLKGLLMGISRMNQDMSLKGAVNMPGIGSVAIRLNDMSDWTNQYYGQYSWKKLVVDAEYRRYYMLMGSNGVPSAEEDIRGWYLAGSYQIAKRVQLGSYYSRYWISFPIAYVGQPPATGHDYDKVVTGRVDLNRFMNIKVEGHFMDGYGLPNLYPNGFYTGVNPLGLKPNTIALVVKTGFNF